MVVGLAIPAGLVLRAVLSGRSWMALGLDADVMTAFAWAAGLGLVARVVSVFEVWHSKQWSRQWSWTTMAALALVAGMWAMLGFSVVEATRARHSVDQVFAEPLAEPLFDSTRNQSTIASSRGVAADGAPLPTTAQEADGGPPNASPASIPSTRSGLPGAPFASSSTTSRPPCQRPDPNARHRESIPARTPTLPPSC